MSTTGPETPATGGQDRDGSRRASIAQRSPEEQAALREERTLTAARAVRTQENTRRIVYLLLSIITPVLLIVLWEITARVEIIDPRFFPPPSRIAAALRTMTLDGELWSHTWPTLTRLLVGGGLGAVCGIVVGLLMGVFRPLNAAFGPLFSALYPLPKIAIFPILLMIFGPTELPKMIAVFITTFFVMQINTVSGVWAIDRKLLEAGSAYGATGLDRFRFVVLPGALPFVFSGLRTATGTAVVVITAVEFTGASTEGLGYLIWNSWQLFMPEKLYVGLVVIGVIGALLTWIITSTEKLVLPWRRR